MCSKGEAYFSPSPALPSSSAGGIGVSQRDAAVACECREVTKEMHLFFL